MFYNYQMVSDLSKNTGGRPLKITTDSELILSKLTYALRIGQSIHTACKYARIGEKTFYRYYKERDWFRQEIDAAKSYASVLAADQIFDVLQDILRGKNKKFGNRLNIKKCLMVTFSVVLLPLPHKKSTNWFESKITF